MKSIAFYNPDTRVVTATANLISSVHLDPEEEPWVDIPDGVDIQDPAEWEVQEDGTLKHVGRPITTAEVRMERDRRLSLGFQYDFQDERGVHHIGTTPADMEKWVGEVTPISNAYLNLGTPEAEIRIKTETGNVSVTAAEWQTILAAAMAVRQPIYQGYFNLKVMDPIPSDYQADHHWTA